MSVVSVAAQDSECQTTPGGRGGVAGGRKGSRKSKGRSKQGNVDGPVGEEQMMSTLGGKKKEEEEDKGGKGGRSEPAGGADGGRTAPADGRGDNPDAAAAANDRRVGRHADGRRCLVEIQPPSIEVISNPLHEGGGGGGGGGRRKSSSFGLLLRRQDSDAGTAKDTSPRIYQRLRSFKNLRSCPSSGQQSLAERRALAIFLALQLKRDSILISFYQPFFNKIRLF